MTPGKAVPQAQLLGTRDDRPLDRADIGGHGPRSQMCDDGVELGDVRSGWSGEHQEIGDARDIDRTGWRIVEGAVLGGQRPFRRFGRPTYDRDSPEPRAPSPYPLRLHLAGDRAANRAEPDQAEGLGSHGLEGTRPPHIMEPHADGGDAEHHPTLRRDVHRRGARRPGYAGRDLAQRPRHPVRDDRVDPAPRSPPAAQPITPCRGRGNGGDRVSRRCRRRCRPGGAVGQRALCCDGRGARARVLV